MTEMVTCRVCGCLSPLGTAECPDCGAPLPQELPREETPVSEPARECPETEGEAARKEKPLARHPLLRRVALFMVMCLVVELAAAFWPQKPEPPGMYLDGSRVITPEGIWEHEKDGFFYMSATADGRYALFQKAGEGTAIKVRRVGEALYSAQTSLSLSYTYAPDGDYYLFDGRTLEQTDWDEAGLTDSGAAFYTLKDERGTTLCWRDLNTGEDCKIQTFGEGVVLDILKYSADGTAVAYRWAAADGEEPGSYRLWRAKERKSVALDVPGDLWGVGKGGETCLFWAENSEEGGILYGWDGDTHYGTLRGYYDRGYFLWRDGETVPLPNMLLMWANNDFTQLLLRDYQDDYAGEWYYFDVDAMTQPVRLGIPGYGYLSSTGLYSEYHWDTLTGHFYLLYDGGASKVYYLTRKGELLLAEERLEGEFRLDAAGQKAVYLKNNDLFCISVLPGDTLETQRLTGTAAGDAGDTYGNVTAFAADEDLRHVYYVTQGQNGRSMRYWHDGEDTLVMDYETNYGTIPMTVAPDGACYFSYGRDLYYTKGGAEPKLLLEDAGAFAIPELVGPEQWCLLRGAGFTDGKNQERFWYLNGDKEPVELTEWVPKEGTL